MQDATTAERLRGSCHCGNIRFDFAWPEPGQLIPVRACGCAFCTKPKAVWTSHPAGRFSIEVGDEAQLLPYRFGTRTADFHVCLACGVVPASTCVIGGRRYAVLNVNTFDGVDRARLVERATYFEGETTESRLARRARNWTPEAPA